MVPPWAVQLYPVGAESGLGVDRGTGVGCATTSPNSSPWATELSSNPPHNLNPHRHNTTRLHKLRSLGLPTNAGYFQTGDNLPTDPALVCRKSLLRNDEQVIPEVDHALRTLIERQAVDPAEVEVEFDAPRQDWASRRNAPTIDVYLYDIREGPAPSRAGTAQRIRRPRRTRRANRFCAHRRGTG